MADHIRQLVVFGELRDGERVPQPEAAENACWSFIDEIGELVAQRFSAREKEIPPPRGTS